MFHQAVTHLKQSQLELAPNKGNYKNFEFQIGLIGSDA